MKAMSLAVARPLRGLRRLALFCLLAAFCGLAAAAEAEGTVSIAGDVKRPISAHLAKAAIQAW